MKTRLIIGAVLGASLLGGVAVAQPVIATFEAHNDMHAGALWKNDKPNNYQQRGAGMEHQSITQLANGKILVVGTASYTDVTPMIAGAGLSSVEANVLPPKDGDPGVQPQGDRVQGLCISYSVDPTKGLVMNNMAYFTKNTSPDWRNAHKPHVQPVNSGAAALVQYGYAPDGNNTKVYGMVLGPNCEIQSAQTLLFANNNDNLGGLWDSAQDGTTVSDAGGTTRSCGGLIGNGNGDDDVWMHCTSTVATGAGAYKITPDFKTVVDPEEERSRGVVSTTPFPNMMFSCWASGNTQPTYDIKCGMLDTTPGIADAQRLVWRATIAKRNGNIRYSSPSIVPMLDDAGKPTARFIMSYVKVDISNRTGRSKGRTTIQTVPVEISAKGVTMLDTPKENLFSIGDGSHPGMTVARYGADNRSVAFLFAGNITDGGVANAKIVGMTADGKVEPIRAINWASATSGGRTSQWYGQNPNTPQGRSYPVTSMMINNPGYKVAGGFQPAVKTFVLAANVYHKDHTGECGAGDGTKGTNDGTCGGKNAFGMVLIPANADATTGDPTNPGDPTDPTKGGGTSDPGTTLGGCSTTGGAGGGSLALLGLALVLIRRRRSN